jgi:hypothetical protein
MQAQPLALWQQSLQEELLLRLVQGCRLPHGLVALPEASVEAEGAASHAVGPVPPL